MEDFFAGGNIIYTDQCENLSDYYFSAAETGVCDFVQKNVQAQESHSLLQSVYDFFYINKWSMC